MEIQLLNLPVGAASEEDSQRSKVLQVGCGYPDNIYSLKASETVNQSDAQQGKHE